MIKYLGSKRRLVPVLGAMFAVASVLIPFCLGSTLGGVASGRVKVGNAAGDPWSSWLNPTSILIGVLGFVLMLAGTAYAVSAHRRPGPTGVVTGGSTVRRPAGKGRRNKGTFLQRLEERWERRRGER